jgi:hypothetical protein
LTCTQGFSSSRLQLPSDSTVGIAKLDRFGIELALRLGELGLGNLVVADDHPLTDEDTNGIFPREFIGMNCIDALQIRLSDSGLRTVITDHYQEIDLVVLNQPYFHSPIQALRVHLSSIPCQIVDYKEHSVLVSSTPVTRPNPEQFADNPSLRAYFDELKAMSDDIQYDLLSELPLSLIWQAAVISAQKIWDWFSQNRGLDNLEVIPGSSLNQVNGEGILSTEGEDGVEETEVNAAQDGCSSHISKVMLRNPQLDSYSF